MNNVSLKKVVVRYFDYKNFNYEDICRYKNLNNESFVYESLFNRDIYSVERGLRVVCLFSPKN